MDIVIDLTPIFAFFEQPADVMLMRMLVLFGWLPIAFVFLWGAKEIWMEYIGNKWGATNTFVLLAIDIPRANQQTPRAVENILTYLAGAHGTTNLVEKYWVGKFQLNFSLEIVSIEGYTQFLIHSPSQFRNLVESAIYSQYPDAEITEVNDYTAEMPTSFPDDEYDCWGSEFIQAKPEAYPIKTYESFFYQDEDKELRFKDPIASFMDLCSTLGPGEQLWYQIIIKPIGFDWTDNMQKEVGKILKETPKSKPGLADVMIDGFLGWLQALSEMVFSLWGDVSDSKDDKKEDEGLKMMNLKPSEKKKIEFIQSKISKLGFEAKNRFVYIARKEVMNKPKVVNGFVGYMKQFVDTDLNNLKPDMGKTATNAIYFFKESRISSKQTRIVSAYKGRSSTRGRQMKIFSIEELATLWHFPVESYVRAPLIQKAPGRKAVPPMSLPSQQSEESVEPDWEREQEESEIFGAFATGDYAAEERGSTGARESAPAGLPVEDEPPTQYPGGRSEEEEIFAPTSQETPAETTRLPEPPSQPSQTGESGSKGSPPPNLPVG